MLYDLKLKQRSEEHTSELQSRFDLVCRLLLDLSSTKISTLSLHDALPILEARFGKGVMDHVQELVEFGALKEKSADLIFQVSSGLFGARKDDKYSEEAFLENALRPEVKA